MRGLHASERATLLRWKGGGHVFDPGGYNEVAHRLFALGRAQGVTGPPPGVTHNPEPNGNYWTGHAMPSELGELALRVCPVE